MCSCNGKGNQELKAKSQFEVVGDEVPSEQDKKDRTPNKDREKSKIYGHNSFRFYVFTKNTNWP